MPITRTCLPQPSDCFEAWEGATVDANARSQVGNLKQTRKLNHGFSLTEHRNKPNPASSTMVELGFHSKTQHPSSRGRTPRAPEPVRRAAAPDELYVALRPRSQVEAFEEAPDLLLQWQWWKSGAQSRFKEKRQGNRGDTKSSNRSKSIKPCCRKRWPLKSG